MTPWFAITLHWIRKPDAELHLHDHPVTFLSLIIRGYYVEHRDKGKGDGRRLYLRRFWNWIKASPGDRHRIVSCDPDTLTLCFMGPKRREWGYHTPGGWVYWRDYNRSKYGAWKTRNQG